MNEEFGNKLLKKIDSYFIVYCYKVLIMTKKVKKMCCKVREGVM